MLVVVLVAMMPLALVMVLKIFGFQKKARGSAYWFILLPLNPHGLFRKASRKLTTTHINGYIC